MVSLSRVEQELSVVDEAARDVLNEMLTQLKIQNEYLALVTDNEINEEDLEDAGN